MLKILSTCLLLDFLSDTSFHKARALLAWRLMIRQLRMLGAVARHHAWLKKWVILRFSAIGASTMRAREWL